MEQPKCQMYCVRPMADGVVRGVPQGLVSKVKVMLTRRLGPARKRVVKQRLARYYLALNRALRRGQPPPAPQVAAPAAAPLQAGDRVRVKSRAEIEATVGVFKDLKGLTFMPEMWPYCGTEQRVFKRLVRFFDERDYQVRRARGIVLLEGLMCEGTAMFGPCDRSCFFFWREEWLEKIA